MAKTGGEKYQWQIMRSLGIEDEEIRRFADPHYWIEYFPVNVKRDLEMMGLKVSEIISFFTLTHCVPGRLASFIYHHGCQSFLRFVCPLAISSFERRREDSIRQTVSPTNNTSISS